MQITIQECPDIIIDNWESGASLWFHIRQGDNEISFNYKNAKAIYDALGNCIIDAQRILSKRGDERDVSKM